MYVGLIVRDECERSVKNQVSKVEQVDFTLARNYLARSNQRKEPRVEYTTRR